MILLSLSNKLKKAQLISPWINKNLLSLLDKRKKLYSIYKKPYDLHVETYFKQFCNKLSNSITETMNSFYSKQIEKCQGDVGMQWKIINRVAGRDDRRSVERVELDNGDIVVEPFAVAEEVNNYLIAAAQIAVDNGLTVPLTLTHRLNSFFVSPTTENEVCSVIHNLKNNKSSGFECQLD